MKKKFYIIINNDSKRPAGYAKQKLIDWMEAEKDRVEYEIFEGHVASEFAIPDDSDVVITVGGDGTMLRAARGAIGKKAVLLGVNRGHVGYLTEISEVSQLNKVLPRLIDGSFMTEERMMLETRVVRGRKIIFKDYALNEVLITKQSLIKPTRFSVDVNDIRLNEYNADGIIVATPTGSTGYSMSAGGSIAEPSSRLILLTPVCPHAINSKPIVLAPNDIVRVNSELEKQVLSCDGKDGVQLEVGDEIIVKRSSKSVKFVKFTKTSFLEILSNKMKYI